MNDNKLISDSQSEISLFPHFAGNKGRFTQPTVRFPIFGINDNMLVVVWGLGVLRRGSGETTEVLAGSKGRWSPHFTEHSGEPSADRQVAVAWRNSP